MKHPTVQDIFLRFYPEYLDKYTPSSQQSKVANCIINCKTGAYGANVSMPPEKIGFAIFLSVLSESDSATAATNVSLPIFLPMNFRLSGSKKFTI